MLQEVQLIHGGSKVYQRTAVDYCVYFKRFPCEKFFILLLYVDDMLIVG